MGLFYGFQRLPLSDPIRTYNNFIAGLDTRLRNPKWVIEHLSKDKLKGEGTRASSQFVEDTAVSPRFRSKLVDYKGSGYDRGHMAPASNHKESQESMDQTFQLTNICPQVGEGFNRDYWARFERFVRDTTKSFDDVWVVTGPLYISRPSSSGWQMEHPMLGHPPELVAVPTHFYKVVLAERGHGDTVAAAFVMPNDRIAADYPLAAFSVPLTSLEEVAGLQFFPHLITDAKREALDGAALRWQAAGKTQLARGRIGPPGMPPALLPPPSPTLGNAVTRKVVGTSVSRAMGGEAMGHLCDRVECRLPAEDFWKSGAVPKGRRIERTKSANF